MRLRIARLGHLGDGVGYGLDGGEGDEAGAMAGGAGRSAPQSEVGAVRPEDGGWPDGEAEGGGASRSVSEVGGVPGTPGRGAPRGSAVPSGETRGGGGAAAPEVRGGSGRGAPKDDAGPDGTPGGAEPAVSATVSGVAAQATPLPGAGGAPIFVPGALPGEVVEGDIANGRLSALRIVEPSPDRVRPPCPHYRGCGACSLQHASDGFLADWKVGVVRAALEAQGLDTVMRPPAISPPGTRRRATLAGRRTKKGAIVGFHGKASGTISAVTNCKVLHPALLAMIPVCERLTLLGGSRKGEVSFALTVSEVGVDMAVDGAKPPDLALRRDIAAVASDADLARLTWDGELIAGWRLPVQNFGAVAVVPPPGAFLQATAEGEAALVAAVREAVGDAARAVDLFAGCGTFALALAPGCAVHAVEGDAALAEALTLGARSGTGLKPVTVETRDLFRRPLMANELAGYDAAVIDPPRAGAEAQITALAASGVARIVAVSCNPVSFARDAKVLTDAGFRLDWVQVVDQFRWSAHVELAAQFTRPRIAPARKVRHSGTG